MVADVIGVAVVEDHPLYRQGLMKTVDEAASLMLVASTISVEDLDRRGYDGVDVVILDLHLPGCQGAEAVRRVRDHGPAVLVLSASDDREHVVDAVAAGAGGYVTKAADAGEILAAISTVAEGRSYVSPRLAAFLLESAQGHEASGADALTAREKEILSLVAAGETDVDIAERLFISVRTVRSHLDRIRDKTGRRRRADLTRLALEQRRGPEATTGPS